MQFQLDYKVTEKKLREVFKLAGKVRDVELSVDADGKSRGFAVVEYDHPVESVQAICKSFAKFSAVFLFCFSFAMDKTFFLCGLFSHVSQPATVRPTPYRSYG